jgi:transcriptional regulator with XRE-family HTH domain
LTIIDKSKIRNLNYFGQRVRELREKREVLLRQIAAQLEVDTALLSKIERGDRNASRDQVVKIAEFLKVDLDELLTLWLADKVESAIGGERKIALDAMDIVKKKFKK